MVFNTLNRLKWTGKLDSCEIAIVHRGAKDNRKMIDGKQVTTVKKGYFCFKDGHQEIYIPNHRVIEIILGGEIIWKRCGR